LNVDVGPEKGHSFSHALNSPLPKLKEVKGVGYVPEDSDVVRHDGKVTYAQAGRVVDLPEEEFNYAPWVVDHFVGLPSEKRSFVALYSGDSGYPFKLASFNGKGGNPVWVADVWASRRGFSSGVGHHRVELQEATGSVFVFGAESHGMYLEAFEAATGKCLFRFCTCYWSNFSEEWGFK
jgi:hypothetical protein